MIRKDQINLKGGQNKYIHLSKIKLAHRNDAKHLKNPFA